MAGIYLFAALVAFVFLVPADMKVWTVGVVGAWAFVSQAWKMVTAK